MKYALKNILAVYYNIIITCFFFSCFHGFGKEPLNCQETIREKTHLARIHLQE